MNELTDIVIIPSAKANIIKQYGNMPPIISPIGGGIVLDYLLRMYPGSKMRVIISEQAEKILSILNNTKYCSVEKVLLEKSTDIAVSVLNGIEDAESIIINFGDTIVDDVSRLKECNDGFLYSEEYYSNEWTFFEKTTTHFAIIDKQKKYNHSSSKGRVFVGVFKISHAQYFKACILNALNYNKEISTFYNALMQYNDKYELRPVLTNHWLDVGHADRYSQSSQIINARQFNSINIDSDRGILYKTSTHTEKLINEIQWYLKLPKSLQYICPRIFDYSLNNPCVSMEYYTYSTLHELMLYSSLTYGNWKHVFEKLYFVCNDMRQFTCSGDGFREACTNMYIDKTIERLEQLRGDVRFKKYFVRPICVNGMRYKSLGALIDIIRHDIECEIYSVVSPSIIHGDLCFSNILIDSTLSFIKVIDPRGSFGVFDIYGDPRYELAKILHSIDGKYDFIIKDMFSIEINDDGFSFCINNTEEQQIILSAFKEVFSKDLDEQARAIEIIESLLFLSMIPLHNEDYHQQLAMLGTGLEILNRYIDITED